jgi:hypothetical protein
VIDGVVRPAAASELRALVVWLPILPEDDATAAARAAERCAEPRVSHYWDPDRTLGEALGKALALPPREVGREHGVAWDVYLLFEQGAQWGAAPSFWMHQLDGVPATKAPRLNVALLQAKLSELVAKRLR